MDTVQGFVINQLSEDRFVVEGNSFYQNIDFVNGGLITSMERAIAIRDLLIESLNTPASPIVKSTDDRVSDLELKLAETQLALAELAEVALGGV